MTLEESKEVIPMMEAMITQIEEQQNIIMGGAILFSMIAGIACIVYSIENREE